MSLSTHLFMKHIHSDFFEIVHQTFNMDREKMYRVAFDDPILKKKQDLIVEEIDKISYGKINPETLQGKKDILRAISLNNIVMEGIFFYSTFAHFFELKEMVKINNVMYDVVLV